MKTMTKRQLPLLAVVALLAAACDPFPAAPGGTPTLLRAIATGDNYVEVVDPADPNAILLDDVDQNALLYIQFNKPLDGTSIQATPNYDANGNELPNPCDAAGSPLTNSGWPAGTQICYYPSSPDAGGQINVIPGDFLETGDYVIGGTVRDYEGKTTAFSVTVRVTARPTQTPIADAYTIDMRWAAVPGATGYTVERSPVATPPTWVTIATNAQWVSPGAAVPIAVRDYGLVPGTHYLYRVTAEGVTGATPSNPSEMATAALPFPGTVYVAATQRVEVRWGRIRGAGESDGNALTYNPSAVDPAYTIERAQPNTDDSGPDEATWTEIATYIAPASSATPLVYVDNPGSGSHYYRFIPQFGALLDGTAAGPGTPSDWNHVVVP